MSKNVQARIYDKYLVKRASGGIGIPLKKEDGSPELGDVVKTNIKITPYKASLLNEGWDNKAHPISYFYKEQEQKPEKSEERLLIEEEAQKLGVKFRDNIGDAKLKEKINEAKGE